LYSRGNSGKETVISIFLYSHYICRINQTKNMAKNSETVLVEDKMLRTKKRFSLATYEKYMKNSKYHGAQRFVITEDATVLPSKSPDPAPKKKDRVKNAVVNKPAVEQDETAAEKFLREHNEQKLAAANSETSVKSDDSESQGNEQSEGGDQ